jgi:hypothetical protein
MKMGKTSGLAGKALFHKWKGWGEEGFGVGKEITSARP